MFVRSGTTWTEQQKLLGDDESSFSWFGTSVALSGDTAAVLASAQGMATYIFVRNGTTWTLQQKAGYSGAAVSDCLAISGDTAVIGTGVRAHVLVRSGTTWSEQQELVPSVASQFFGYAVDIVGDLVMVGAQAGFGTGEGSAYLFVRSGTTWSEEARLTASDGSDTDLFGNSVAVSGVSVVVGAEF